MNDVLIAKVEALDEKLDLIYEQTLKTNGRVTVTEGKVEALELKAAGEEGGKKALKPLWLFVTSVLTAVVTAFAVKNT